MLNSQSLSINQKIKLWKEHKEDKFKQIATDKCAMFNFFLNNNDIFHFIDDGDFDFYSFNVLKVMDSQANIFIGCFIGVVLFDRLILNRFFPRVRFQKWRLTANLIKYLVWPFTIFKPIQSYLLKPYRENMYLIQEKYDFGFQDYIRGNRIFERALAVNRLEELLEKRQNFDWTNVPELPQ